MAESKKFNLSDILSQRSKEAIESNRKAGSRETIKVDIDCLEQSKNNFYSMEAIKELKQSIELLGVLQPILVTEEKESGKRTILAGHRRYIALQELVKEGKEQFKRVPAVVKSKQSEIMDELTLIMANRFREKTDWEKMNESIKTEELVLKLKESTDIQGRTRDLLAEITATSPAQLGRYKAVYNHLIEPLMQIFQKNYIAISVAYEVSSLPEQYQIKAAELFGKNATLTLQDIKSLKADYEGINVAPASQQSPEDAKEETDEAIEHEPEEHVKDEETEQSQKEYFEPEPETITSLCYSCNHYEECNEKRATTTKCSSYINRREAQKTEEERYNEEQAAIDRETARKLREMKQDEKMRKDITNQERYHDIRITQEEYNDILQKRLTFLLLKKDGYKIEEHIKMRLFIAGKATGTIIEAVINYIWEDWTGLDDDYCIIGFGLKAERSSNEQT